jgi:hypothetical protein
MFMSYQYTKFHIPSYSDPLVIAIAINHGIQTAAAILLFCILQKQKQKNKKLNERRIFLDALNQASPALL